MENRTITALPELRTHLAAHGASLLISAMPRICRSSSVQTATSLWSKRQKIWNRDRPAVSTPAQTADASPSCRRHLAGAMLLIFLM
jgi:hypothetical protein